MIREVSFRNGHGGILKISEGALLKMKAFVQNRPAKSEAGGVLLGRFIVDSADVIVDDVTIPMPEDRRTHFRFFRKAKRHQAAIDHVWTRSAHRCNYLGGWHAHAEPMPNFSDIDANDWESALRKEQFDNDVLYFVIIGTSAVCAWEGEKVSCRISQLQPVPHSEV